MRDSLFILVFCLVFALFMVFATDVDAAWSWKSISSANAPDARSGHIALWTGTEMIIWGGTDGTGVVDTGACYDPSTDTWTTMTTDDAPGAREWCAVAWTGSKMVIWGGAGASSCYADGYTYDPATDTWASISSSSLSARRPRYSWTGSELAVFCGDNSKVGGYPTYNNGALYDPSTDTWTSMATCTLTNTHPHTPGYCPWTGSAIVSWAGKIPYSSWINSGALYNPSTNTWTSMTTSSAPSGRHSPAVAYYDGTFCAWGGNGAVSVPLGNGGVYDISGNSWTAMNSTDAPDERWSMSSAYTEAGDFFIWGGSNQDGAPTNYLDDGVIYDISSDIWTAISTTGAPTARVSASATWTGDSFIVWGGLDGIGKLGDGKICSISISISPDISISPTPWDYGNTPTGNYPEKTFTVSNPGTATLNVSLVSITGADSSDFSIQSGGGSFTLIPDSTHDIVVRFSPSSVGSKIATLNLANNVSGKNPLNVTLEGNGTIPDISSGTHTEGVWSNNNDPSFNWTEPSGASGITGYSYEFDNSASTTPDTTSEGTATSKSYTDKADGTWYFHVRAKDGAGNWGNADHYGPVKIDTAAPPVPVVSSETHTEGVWSSNNDPSFNWTAPSDTSGITGYSYEFDDSASTTPDTTSEGTAISKSYTDKADGTWYFHVRAKDGAGNWGSADHYGSVKIDTAAPPVPVVSSGTHTEGVWSNNNDPSFNWTAPSDTSGITGYSYEFDNSATTTPDTTSEGTATSKSYTDKADGTWYFHVRAKDGTGNWGDADHYGQVKIDTAAPGVPVISSSTHAEDIWSSNDDPSFNWTAPSDTSGITGYSYEINHSPSTIPDTTSEGSSNSKNYSNIAAGTWYFHVRAKDGADNWGSADHYGPVKIDTTAPVAPVVYDDGDCTTDGSQLHASWVSFDGESGIAEYQYAIGTTPCGVNVVDWTSAGTSVEVTRTGLSLTPGQTYYTSVKARNEAGLWSSCSPSNGITYQLPEIGVTPGSLTFNAVTGGTDPNPKSLSVTNPGCGALSWSISDNAAWLSCAPASGSCTDETDTVTVSVDITGLSYGIHNAIITITAITASNTPQTVSVTLELTETFSITLNTPNGGEKIKGGSVYNITWETAGEGIHHLRLQYSTNSGGAYADIDDNTPDDGIYEWTTPFINSSTVRVKAIAEDASDNTLVADESNGNFTIDSLAPATSASFVPTGENGWWTSDVQVTLSVTADLSGVKETRYRMDGGGALVYTAPFTVISSATIYYYSEDNVGNTEAEKSAKINIDRTAPITPVVYDDGDCTTDGSQLHASWVSSDDESGIAEYQYAIGTTPCGVNVVDWTSSGTSAEVTRTGLSLTLGQTYYTSVKARNEAGLWSFCGPSNGITYQLPEIGVTHDLEGYSAQSIVIL